MNTVEKIELIRIVAAEIDRRYVLSEVKAFLTEFDIKVTQRKMSNSMQTYVRNRLIGINDTTLIEMAKQLEVGTKNLKIAPAKQETLSPAKPAMPKLKNDSSPVKAFISHSTKNKIYANAIRKIFKKYGIEAFVSGKDIKGGQKWRKRIRNEINEMEIFIAIHTQAFSESLWCQQEAGLALVRENDIEIIPINSNKGKAPESFLDDFQYIERKSKTTETVVREIFETLKESEKTNKLYFAKIEPKVKQVDEDAEKAIYDARLESINALITTVGKIKDDFKKDRRRK